MPPTEILLIRHGETAWNAEHRLQGHLDIALNERGRQQAFALGAALADEPLDAIWSSDLGRALETARAIGAAKGMTVKIDAALRERCFGGFEGLRPAEIETRYPEAYQAWKARSEDYRFPAGSNPPETLAEFARRAVEGVARLAAACPGGKVAMVSHGGVLDCLHRAAHGVPQSDPAPVVKRNASVNRLMFEAGRFQLLAWGDVSHLEKPALDEVG